ncbi:MAG: hypothetical protein FJ271_12245 [Planctomycetes bacterium]|nr:hypothetical protein [Planctomycetota bacterium]
MQPPDFLKKMLPEGIAGTLDSIWLFIVAGAALIVLLILWVLVRKLFRKEKKHPTEIERIEKLAEYPDLPPSKGDRRLVVEGVPVRLRLVVVAPAGGASRVDRDNIDQLLDKVLPGLGDITSSDRPRVQVWPVQLSYEGFANTFHRGTLIPEGEDQPSRWALLAGRAMVGKNQFLLGLGVQAIKPNTIGRKTLKSHDWSTLLRVRVRE